MDISANSPGIIPANIKAKKRPWLSQGLFSRILNQLN
jgi:hypothetical protein